MNQYSISLHKATTRFSFSLFLSASEHMKKKTAFKHREPALVVLCGRLVIAVGDRSSRVSIAICIRTAGRTGLGPMTSPEIDQRPSSRFVHTFGAPRRRNNRRTSSRAGKVVDTARLLPRFSIRATRIIAVRVFNAFYETLV